METEREKRHRTDREHLANPQVGDYWREMFTPVCVVLGRDGDEVVLCKATRAAGPDHWTWDLRRVGRMALGEFAGWLSYDGVGLEGKTWASVSPGAHGWAREAAKAAVLGPDPGEAVVREDGGAMGQGEGSVG